MEKNVYCPVCEKLGRKKLLFRCSLDAKGTLRSFCKGCKKEITIELKGEPESRKTD